MDTETDDEQQKAQQDEATKFQQAMFVRYQPQEGRADRLASNLPGARSIGSTKGTNR